MIAYGRVTFAFLFASSSQRHPLVKRDIIADDGGLADDRPHAVVNEETVSYFCSGMDLNASEQPRELRIKPRQKAHVVTPQPVAQVMRPDRLQSRIAGENLKIGASGGVRLEDCGNVFKHRGEEARHVTYETSPGRERVQGQEARRTVRGCGRQTPRSPSTSLRAGSRYARDDSCKTDGGEIDSCEIRSSFRAGSRRCARLSCGDIYKD